MGLPSASAMYRYKACPKSHRLSEGIESYRTQKMVSWGESGDRVHAALAGDFVELNPQEEDVRDKCMQQDNVAIEEAGLAGMIETVREKRLWLMDGKKKVLSGKADRISMDAVRGIVIDYKSSYGDQDPADENYQVRTNIVLAADEWPHIELWYGGINQPLVSNHTELVCYTRDDVAAARAEILSIIADINNTDSPTNSGSHCRWCPAVLRCESARALLQTFKMIDPNTADGDALAGYLDLCKHAKPIIDRLEGQAKKMIAEGLAVPGWKLGKQATMRTISDPFQAFNLLESAGLIDRDSFLRDCVSVGIGDAEKAVAKFKAMKSGEAKDAVNATICSVIEFKKKSASLEKIA